MSAVIVLGSGCAAGGFDRPPASSTGTVDVCYTQATETSCYRERSAHLADSMERLHEQEEMAQLESLDDW